MVGSYYLFIRDDGDGNYKADVISRVDNPPEKLPMLNTANRVNKNNFFVVDPGTAPPTCINPSGAVIARVIMCPSFNEVYWGKIFHKDFAERRRGTFVYHPHWTFAQLLEQYPFLFPYGSVRIQLIGNP